MPLQKRSRVFFQGAIVLIGVGAFVFLLWEPNIEGRNAHATLFEVYFKDPFLAYAYVASTPFFVALFQAFKALGYAGRDGVFPPPAVKALRTIQYCAIALIGLVAVGEIFILLGESDDRAGGVFMGILVTFGSVAIAATAAMIERAMTR